MAEEKTIVLKLETITDQAVMEAYGDTLDSVLGKYDENVKQLNAFNAQLKANNDAIKAINAEAAKTGQTTKEQSEAIAKLTAENGKLNAQKAQLVQITKNQEKIETTVTGSMDNQSQILGKLRMAWRKMTDEQKQANSGLLDTINQLDKGLKDSDGSIGNFQRNVGDYKNAIVDAFAQLKGEIKQYKNELLTLEEGTDEYNETLAKLGNAQFQMKDMTDKAKYAVDDLGEKLNTVSAVGQGVIGGFNAIQGAMALFGGESEDLQKTMLKLQAGMAVVQGLQGVEGLIDSVNGLKIQFAGSIDKVKGFITSLKGVRGAVIASGIGLLAAALGTAVAHWDELSKMFEDSAEKAAEMNEELNNLAAQSSAEKIIKVKELSMAYKNLGDDMNSRKRFVEDYKDELADMGIEMNNVNDADRIFVKQTDAYINALMQRAKADGSRTYASKVYQEALEGVAKKEKAIANIKKVIAKGTGISPGQVGALGIGDEATLTMLNANIAPTIQMNFKAIRNLEAEIVDLKREANASAKKLLGDAAQLDAEADKYLAKRKKKIDDKKKKGEGGSSEDSDLERLKKLQRDTQLALMDEAEREYAILDEQYKEERALYDKYGKDTTELTKLYAKKRGDILQKSIDPALEATRQEIADGTASIQEEFTTMLEEIEQGIANDSALGKVAESPLARALGVSDEEFESIKSKAQSLATQLFSSISQISQDATQRRVDNEIETLENEAKREKDILKSKLDKGLISQKEYEKKLEDLDEESAKKKEQINKEAFVKNKAWNIAQAVMNTALAITNILATNKGGAIARAIEIATASATGIAQVATIAAQKYARGGILYGPSHAQGGIQGFVGNSHIEVEGGEYIINKHSARKYSKLLSLINSDNGWGVDFANARSGSRFARGGILGYNLRTSALPDTRGGLAMFAQQQTENIQNAISAINQRIDNLRVYLPLSDIEQRSNEKRVNVSRAVL